MDKKSYLFCFVVVVLCGLFLFLNQYASSAIPVTTVAQGGTGVGTLSGLLKGNGTSSVTSITSIPRCTIYATTTAWIGSTTITLANTLAQTWTGIGLKTNTGTLNVAINDLINYSNVLTATSSTGGVIINQPLTVNNSFNNGEAIFIEIGNPVSNPTSISICGNVSY
jgi:hypothetical protein